MGAKNGFGLGPPCCVWAFSNPLWLILLLAILMSSRQKRQSVDSTFFQTSTHAETDVDPEYFITKEQTDMYRCLYQQFFNWLLKWQNLGLELGAFVDGDSSGNDRPGHSTCTAKSLLGTNKYIWHILKGNNADAIVTFTKVYLTSSKRA